MDFISKSYFNINQYSLMTKWILDNLVGYQWNVPMSTAEKLKPILNLVYTGYTFPYGLNMSVLLRILITNDCDLIFRMNEILIGLDTHKYIIFHQIIFALRFCNLEVVKLLMQTYESLECIKTMTYCYSSNLLLLLSERHDDNAELVEYYFECKNGLFNRHDLKTSKTLRRAAYHNNKRAFEIIYRRRLESGYDMKKFWYQSPLFNINHNGIIDFLVDEKILTFDILVHNIPSNETKKLLPNWTENLKYLVELINNGKLKATRNEIEYLKGLILDDPKGIKIVSKLI
jgi:hypothetical protein